MTCISNTDLARFLDLTQIPHQWLSETALIVHATAHNVLWSWSGEWCPTIIQGVGA